MEISALPPLSIAEANELVAILYALTWGYSEDEEADTKRLQELRIKRERLKK
jgi:hypothetical protein